MTDSLDSLQSKIDAARESNKKVIVFATVDMCYFENFVPIADTLKPSDVDFAVFKVDGVKARDATSLRRPDDVTVIDKSDIPRLRNVDVFCCSFLRDLPEGAITLNFHHDILEVAPPYIYDYYMMPSRWSLLTLAKHSITGQLEKHSDANKLIRFVPLGYCRLDRKLSEVESRTREFYENATIFFSVPYGVPFENCLLYPNHHSDLISTLKRCLRGKIFLKFHPSREFVDPEAVHRTYINDDRIVMLDDSNSSARNAAAISSSRYFFTDVSGTAYTNALIYRRPVIFYSPFEKGIQNRYFFDQHLQKVAVDENYLALREAVGVVCQSAHELPLLLPLLDMRYNFYVENIDRLLFSSIYNIGKSVEFARDFLMNVIRGADVGESYAFVNGKLQTSGSAWSARERFNEYLKYAAKRNSYFTSLPTG